MMLKSILSKRLLSYPVRHFSIIHPTKHAVKVDNPYTLKVEVEVPFKTKEDANHIIDKTFAAHKQLATKTLDERIEICKKALAWFAANSEEVANDITRQMGKPIKQARGEIKTVAARSEHLFELAKDKLKEEIIKDSADTLLKITKEPLGLVLIIAPWNYPLGTVVNWLIPAILCGNGVLLKHSPRTPLCGQHFEKAFAQAGIEGIVSDLFVDVDTISKLYDRKEIGFVSFTGSVEGGRTVYQTVANSKNIIDVGLELGGKDGFYVAPDADIEKAVENIVEGALYNSGQSCCSIERVYIHDDIYDKFKDAIVFQTSTVNWGNPLIEENLVGPLALPDQPAFLKEQVDNSSQIGAQILCGGNIATDEEGNGRFFEPTVLADCNNGMDVMIRESFGPLIPISSASSDEEAVKLINSSIYGLSAGIYTADKDRALKFAQEIDAGTVFMNNSDFLYPRLPWSGRENSGKGRSLSHYGFDQLYRTKSYNFSIAKK